MAPSVEGVKAGSKHFIVFVLLVALVLRLSAADTDLYSIRDVRLMINGNETSQDRGRVEILLRHLVTGRSGWGAICNTHWDDADATVVCRMQGYQHGVAIYEAIYGEGTEPRWVDDVSCTGLEDTLDQCSHGGFGVQTCNRSQDASVNCSERITTIFPTTTPFITTTAPSQGISVNELALGLGVGIGVLLLILVLVVIIVVFFILRHRSTPVEAEW